ncbi:MAG TPA: pyruvate, phosphate dikinase [bacterium]|nr:pyruvate, phosphate dikinase [bacterium]
MIIPIEQASFDRVEELGLKGAALGDMFRLGLEIPPGFIISTAECRAFLDNGGKISDEMMEKALEGVAEIEGKTGRTYGGAERPLLLSVRSGAAASMPGMMETMLDLGMNPQTVLALINETGDARFAYDCWQRFARIYGRAVFGLDAREFDEAIRAQLDRAGVQSPERLNHEHLKRLGERFLGIIKKNRGRGIPSDPREQLRDAIEAVFLSWNSPQAKTYRNLRRMSHDSGTAVVVQAMRFGNLGPDSAVGSVFTRNPIYGDNKPSGNYLIMAQGEEIQEGRRTPRSVSDHLAEDFPQAAARLREAMALLEKHYRTVQEIEFTIERGKIYFLQTRDAECTATAMVKTAVDMAGEGLITREEAVLRVSPESLGQLLFRYIDPEAQARSLTRGRGGSPGAVYGLVALDAAKAKQIKDSRREVVLVRPDARPEDLEGLADADGLLIAGGNMSGHAFGLIRRAGKPCVFSCPDISIDLESRTFTVGNTTVGEEKAITIDGNTGRVYAGTVKTRETTIGEEFSALLSWADEIKTLGVRGNADTPEDVRRAVEDFGAEGIGLCRTEAMFMAANRLPVMQALVLTEEPSEQAELLDRLKEIQKSDFAEIFKTLNGRPLIVRLLDPPLHEFMPDIDPLMSDVMEMRRNGVKTEAMKLKEALLQRVMSNREVNPMLGLRGCRLGIVRPEIIRMQVEAVFESACDATAEGTPVWPSLLIPLVGHVNELALVRRMIDETASETMKARGMDIPYSVGALIEVPRAALTAAALAEHADFFSFGTNDLTQTTYGISRDDAEHKFLGHYLVERIMEYNPFHKLDPDGVGRLIGIAVADGLRAKPKLFLGLSGEHGADSSSVEFCHKLGIHYISCAPHLVPVARLAAAQAALKLQFGKGGSPQ